MSFTEGLGVIAALITIIGVILKKQDIEKIFPHNMNKNFVWTMIIILSIVILCNEQYPYIFSKNADDHTIAVQNEDKSQHSSTSSNNTHYNNVETTNENETQIEILLSNAAKIYNTPQRDAEYANLGKYLIKSGNYTSVNKAIGKIYSSTTRDECYADAIHMIIEKYGDTKFSVSLADKIYNSSKRGDLYRTINNYIKKD